MMYSVDIVIPTYNRPNRIRPLVTALLSQCGPQDRIIVVSQGPEVSLHDVPSAVSMLRLPRPNLPVARNAGIRTATAGIVLFLDDDIEPQSGLIGAHRSCYADDAVAGVAGFVDDPLFDSRQQRPSFIDLSTGNCVQNFSLHHSGPTVSVMGANMSFRRAKLLSIGGFDERYRSNALWEEIDCCLRIIAAGSTLRYCAEAKVKHLRIPDGGCRQERKYRYLYHQFANTAYFAARFAQPRHYCSWLRFWKHRLEYLSRAPGTRLKTVRHDPVAVLAGIGGAIAGIARYAGARCADRKTRFRIDKKAVFRAVAQAETI
ncbi:MAG: glycosyltransferase family 2 protein [Chitinispirillaceae bacterium]|nr:glycosyltransferase family 2 protein [Chitinispirillaceae bacterium]